MAQGRNQDDRRGRQASSSYSPRHSAPSRRRRSGPPDARRRRYQRLAVTIAVAVVVVLAMGWGIARGVGTLRSAWAAPSLVVKATPADARVKVGSAAATGTVELRDIEAGSYRVVVSRRGYATVSKTVRVERGTHPTISVALKPRPIRFTLDARPDSARYEITTSTGARVTGTGSVNRKLPAGTTSVRVTAAGCKPVTRTFMLDHPVSMTEWLDPSGQVVSRRATFASVPAPKGVAVTPDGKQVWVTALVTQPSVAAYDTTTGRQLGSVDLGSSGAVEIIFSKDGSKAYASQMQSASVYEIDAKRFKVLRKMPTGSSWTKVIVLSQDGTKLYAANWSGDDVSEIDLKTGKLVRRMPTVDTPRGLWPTADGKRLYVAGFGENSMHGRIAVIDLRTGKSRTIFDQRSSAMRHMVADEKRNTLFTSDLGADCVWATDLRTDKTRKFTETDRKPNTIDISPDGRVLFVSCRGENNPRSYNLPGPEWGTVLLFDTKSAKPLDAIIGGNQCTALDLSDNGKVLVFSDFLDARLRVYDIPPFATLAQGRGGLYKAHYARVVKPEWKGWSGPKPPAGTD